MASTTGSAWQWKRIKRKTDRVDALKLARLAAVGEIDGVPVPPRAMRQWKSLIGLRKRLVSERIRGQNRIRGLLVCQGLPAPLGAKAPVDPARLDFQHLLIKKCNALNAWFWVEAATCPATAKSVRKYVIGMAFAVEENEAANPLDIGVFRAPAAMPHAAGLANLVQKAGLAWHGRRRSNRSERSGRAVMGVLAEIVKGVLSEAGTVCKRPLQFPKNGHAPPDRLFAVRHGVVLVRMLAAAGEGAAWAVTACGSAQGSVGD